MARLFISCAVALFSDGKPRVLLTLFLTPSPDVKYESHVRQTLISLKAMRKLRLR